MTTDPVIMAQQQQQQQPPSPLDVMVKELSGLRQTSLKNMFWRNVHILLLAGLLYLDVTLTTFAVYAGLSYAVRMLDQSSSIPTTMLFVHAVVLFSLLVSVCLSSVPWKVHLTITVAERIRSFITSMRNWLNGNVLALFLRWRYGSSLSMRQNDPVSMENLSPSQEEQLLKSVELSGNLPSKRNGSCSSTCYEPIQNLAGSVKNVLDHPKICYFTDWIQKISKVNKQVRRAKNLSWQCQTSGLYVSILPRLENSPERPTSHQQQPSPTDALTRPATSVRFPNLGDPPIMC